MKRYFTLILAIIFAFLLQGCYTKGSPADAPANVAVEAGDTSATVTWDMSPNVEYWVFSAAASNITPQSCYGSPECKMLIKAVSPAIVSGLTNGTTYSFTVNGRINGGAGGPGSPAVQAIPRLAGGTWSGASAMGADDMHGIAYGTLYVAAGNNGALYSSTDASTWTAQTGTPQATANLNAAGYYGGNYIVAGNGGVILSSTDATNWALRTTGTTNNLYAIATSGTGSYVAAGANGTIIFSLDGITWTCASCSGSGNALYGVTYGNGMYVAVGAAGTLITSTDGVFWGTPSAISANDLRGIAYAPAIGTTGTGTFVAVGANGTVLASTDGGTSWAAAVTSPFSSTTVVNAVTYGRQFVAVANDGSIFTSTDGLSWSATTATPANTSPLYAVTHGPYDYTAVGAAGLSMHAK